MSIAHRRFLKVGKFEISAVKIEEEMNKNKEQKEEEEEKNIAIKRDTATIRNVKSRARAYATLYSLRKPMYRILMLCSSTDFPDHVIRAIN